MLALLKAHNASRVAAGRSNAAPSHEAPQAPLEDREEDPFADFDANADQAEPTEDAPHDGAIAAVTPTLVIVNGWKLGFWKSKGVIRTKWINGKRRVSEGPHMSDRADECHHLPRDA